MNIEPEDILFKTTNVLTLSSPPKEIFHVNGKGEIVKDGAVLESDAELAACFREWVDLMKNQRDGAKP